MVLDFKVCLLGFSRGPIHVYHSLEVSLPVQCELIYLLSGRALVVLELFLFLLVTVGQRHPAVLIDLLWRLEVAFNTEVVFLSARVRD